MRSVLVRGITRGVGLFGVAALLGMLIVPNALAQMQRQPLRWNPESNPDPRDLTRAVSSEFDLFGDADLAWIGTRGRGSMRHSFTNDGPADYYFVGQGSILSELNAPAGFSQIYFEGGLWAGTPQSEWNKHRQAVPELNNVTGGGWTQSWNLNAWFLRYPTWWKPADGALGQIHSGVAATDDGSCRDFTSEGINTGSPLGASSDCPDTWGTDQFAGASRLIEFQSWVDYFNAVGGANFTWDWWQVPPEYVTDELIGDWQTYGKIVDWAADNMARFGNAVPGGVGTPEAQGYPMGLSLVWDAFSFANPDVANVTYWRALLINESEQAYGVPLDYDSLYFGNSKGILMNAQAAAQYARPDMAGVFINVNGTNPNCNNAITGNGVPACRYGVDDDSGFGRGAHAILVLNSPIGDLRNKLFSKTVAGTDCAVGTDPFCFPGHPRAGDTLTFNQHRQCDYGGCWANTTNRSARSGFGMHAGIAADMFDGRAPGDFDAGSNWWRTFHNYDYPTRTAAWNRWVPPGNWDWNHDGVLDTLTLESCIGPEFGGAGTGGCSELWSDTLPGRLNNRQGNFGGFVGVGPFPLAAGDTTRWTLAYVTGPSQATIESNARNAVTFYLNSYLGPEAAPAPNIVSVATTPGDRSRDPGATVQLFWDDAPEQWTDIFLLLAASAAQGDAQLVADNPWLPDSIRAVAANNVAAIHIFKTCNNGRTFTNDADCDADRAVDDQGAPIGLGWQPYETLEPDEDGNFPNNYQDEAVTAGKTYKYTVVTQTNGFEADVVRRDDFGNPVAETYTLAPSLYNPLSTSSSDPNVAEVYVPASRQTGGEAATADFTQDDPMAPTAYYPVDVEITSDIEESNDYEIVFGDSVVVTEIRDPVENIALSTSVDVYRTVMTSTDGGATIVRAAYESENFETTNPNGVQVAGGVTTTSAVGDTVTTVYADELALVTLLGSEPLFASSVLDGSNTTPGTFLGRADFPRWLLNVDNSNAGSLDSVVWLEVVSSDSIAQLRSTGTNAQPTMTWLQEIVTATGESYNEYVFEFEDYEFGPAKTFTINLRDPEETNQEFQASLDARAVAYTTVTSQVVADAIGVAAEDLAAVDLPFTVTHNDPERSVQVAMLASDKLTEVPLGRDVDQIMVDVPADKWVPGDQLIFLETVRTFARAMGTAGEYIVTQGGQPVEVDTLLVTWDPAVLGCTAVLTCNPVTADTRGADAASHLPVNPGDASGIGAQMMRVRYLGTLEPTTAYTFTVTATLTGDQVTEVTDADLNEIKVVPNPYVVFSEYEQDNSFRRIMFTGLPPRGKIEIYTVAGQFVQRLIYNEADLAGNGDLFWNMRTRENTDLASGLYIFVVTGELPATGEEVRKLGKFVVIR